jgi:hypothetical protein
MKTQMQPIPTAGKPTTRRSPHPLLRSLVLTSLLVLIALPVSASPAFAETECSSCKPWWGLTTSVMPTNLHSGVAKDEVQEITVEATGGDVLVMEPVSQEYTVFEYDAEPKVVQVALSEIYGVGNVEVTGACEEPDPVTEPGKTKCSYVVTFTNGQGDRPLKLMETELSHLVGLKGQATVTEKTAGTPDGQITVFAENLGDSEVNGTSGAGGVPVDFTDKLPPGMEVTDIKGSTNQKTQVQLLCSSATVSCTFAGTLPPYESIEIVISVKVKEGAVSGRDNEVSVVGGGAPSASGRQPVTVSDAPVPFGVESYGMAVEDEGGAGGGGLDTQAGSHPFQVTTTLDLNQTADPGKPPGVAKDLHFDLPPGLVGNPVPFPQCTAREFDTFAPGGDQCPRDTVMGVASVTIDVGSSVGTFVVPVFNLTPNPGEPARFAFIAEGNPVILDTSVRTGGDYGVTVSVDNITQLVSFISQRVTFWGVPGASTHDASRGWECVAGGRDREEKTPPCTPLGQLHPPPFLTLPTSCPKNPATGEPEPLQTTVAADSWAAPGSFLAPVPPDEPLQSLDGCNRLQFSPEIKVAPDLQEASTPSGLTVDVHVPQEGQLNATGLAQSTLRDTTVTLPAGVAVNPSGADGLEACSEGLVGYLPGDSNPPEELHFTPKLPGSFGTEGSEATLRPGVNFCPNASKIGEVAIETPLLANPLKGFVYLADQNANPFGSLVAMYAVAEDPVSGTLIKLPFNVTLDPSTGQLVASSDSPELPFETAEFHFFGGERAPLSTPAHCGTYTTDASFTPWSGSAPVTSRSSFEITSGPNHGAGGTPCPGASLPFSPSLTGGATNLQAGAFSPFTLTMTRKDGEQNLQSVEAHLPPGLSGILSNIELCSEPQANLGECGPNSLIGETTVSVGVGGHPFSVSGGKFYLTGPYNGSGACTVGPPPGGSSSGCAPFGITFEVPAKAGPFDLERNSANPAGENACDCVLVRGKIEVDPHTAAITITSNPPGTPDAIPTSIEGIPLEIQHVNAITTRGNFQFNPTNCNKMEVTGTIHSSVGGLDTIGVPFQVTNCATLKFAPKFAVSTSGKTSRAKGASLSVKLTYPKAPFGSQANIARVKVDLPKQLPSRLTTLQKACTAAQFNANPAGCPAASFIGHAKAITPLIPVPLEGPAIFVSHGGEAFPSLIVVLQGYGVTLDLVGTTFISKAGITSSTFKTVPDAPVGSFELTLPEGKYSALAANGKLCSLTTTNTVTKKVTVRVKGHKKTVTRKVKQTVAGSLIMPTEFVGQNGAVLKQSTPIRVTGCGKAVRHERKKKHTKKKK